MLACSEVTKLDGSYVRAPYTSHTDAEDALCSGLMRPDRQVSPEDADKHKKECNRSKQPSSQKNNYNTEEHGEH